MSLPEDVIDRFRLENPREFPFERFPKITFVEHPYVMQRQVEAMDLDTYGHVNNSVYLNYAEEAAWQAFSAQGWSLTNLLENHLTITTRRVRIQYLSLAKWGDNLNISAHPLNTTDTGGSLYVGMTRSDASLVAECILDWELVDHKSGGVQPVQDVLRRSPR